MDDDVLLRRLSEPDKMVGWEKHGKRLGMRIWMICI